MPWSSVQLILRRFVDAGYSFRAFDKPSRRFRCIPEALKAHLLKKENLQAWRSNSLRERVCIIRSAYNVRISYFTL